VLLIRYDGTRIVISIPPSGCNELNNYYGGREICLAVVQKMNIITKARQISPAQTSDYTHVFMLARIGMTVTGASSIVYFVWMLVIKSNTSLAGIF
jgi:hypothetical protein